MYTNPMEMLVSFISEYGMNIALLPLIIVTVFFVHEFGHFFAAYLMGMKVDYVSIGAGRTIWTRTDKNGVKWHIHLWPVSAHVHIADYDKKDKSKYWPRLFVVLAGPAANLILPFILLFVFYASIGKPSTPTVITGLQTDLPAYEAGLLPGDEIIAINDKTIRTSEDVKEFTHHTQDNLRFKLKRGNTVIEKNIAPNWYEYKDVNGVNRAHGRIGVFMSQRAYEYKLIRKVNGYEPKDDDDLTRVLQSHLGDTVIMALKSNDGEIHNFAVTLYEDANKHLLSPEGAEDHIIRFGNIGDNFYLRDTIAGSWKMAREESIQIITDIMKLPFNLFPIDKEWLNADSTVTTDYSFTLHYLHFFVYKTALFSVLIAFINLIPIPGLDGSVILLSTAETLRKKALSNRQKAVLIGGILALLYASIFLANAPDMHGYFDFKIESLSESLNEK